MQFDQILQGRNPGDQPAPVDFWTQGLVPRGSEGKLKNLDAVGLALSGGGVRSASFSLGVLQASIITTCCAISIYLSTVSGVLYGVALTTTMTCHNGNSFLAYAKNPRE